MIRSGNSTVQAVQDSINMMRLIGSPPTPEARSTAFRSGTRIVTAIAWDYLRRLELLGLRVGIYDSANARLIDRLNEAGYLSAGTINAMAGYLFPGTTPVPLVAGMDAGTLVNFVTGDWNAVTGLKGNGTSKYINSNRNNNADGRDDAVRGVYVQEGDNSLTDVGIFGAGAASTGAEYFGYNKSVDRYSVRSRNGSAVNVNNDPHKLGYHGKRRTVSTGFNYRLDGTTALVTRASEVPFDGNLLVFARLAADGITPGLFHAGRFSMYHMGPGASVSMTLMDTILADWMADLAGA